MSSENEQQQEQISQDSKQFEENLAKQNSNNDDNDKLENSNITTTSTTSKLPSPPEKPQQKPLILQQQQPPPPLQYTKPDWSGLPKDDYSFEVIKNGISLEIIDFPKSKEFLAIGRLPTCDIPMEHLSISRYHAVLQFNNKGELLIYDLESAHGTILNKRLLPSKSYTKLCVGDQLKFGQIIPKSTLLPKTIDTGVTWGFGEDAEDEGEVIMANAKNSWIKNENAYYYKDPKKAIRNWLENRGYDLEFESEQEGTKNNAKTYSVRVRLPDVEDEFGPVYGIGSNIKKREAERLAAIDACEKLDMLGILRGSQDEAAERSKAKKLKQPQPPKKVETFESLTEQYEEITLKIKELQDKISLASKKVKTDGNDNGVDDDLDSYMNSINDDLEIESKTELENSLNENQDKSSVIQVSNNEDDVPIENNATELATAEETSTNNKKTKKIKFKANVPMTLEQHQEQLKIYEDNNELELEDATTWEPPNDQLGIYYLYLCDGKTFLNEKFGY
ncbi:13602_t:CDS:10 [Entrophospora sp. SA101]|nr:13602_t:CDS:10 [Entrophospora sp. SA101]CAJ0898096.1 16893_t:CDS:10 [Entrophospora sp. SA101]CAJ0898160.1 16900_t:CDS:10 [Entrophospora sp. SA101]